MKTLVVNLFGGPGTGKSTLCANIFANLKMSGIDVEMAPEYVKEVVWEESFKKIENQIYIFGKQHNRMYRLMNKVEVIITDSPLLNSIVYYTGDNPHFEQLVLNEYRKMNNLSYYLERSFDYVQNGRMQSLENAKEIDDIYKKVLNKNEIPYKSINSPYNIDDIVDEIKNRL
jgi:nicotinamide riboside kinase